MRRAMLGLARRLSMARSSRSTWERRISALERSGLSHREFAREHDVKVGTLRSWIYRLRREEPETRLLPVRVAEEWRRSSGSVGFRPRRARSVPRPRSPESSTTPEASLSRNPR